MHALTPNTFFEMTHTFHFAHKKATLSLANTIVNPILCALALTVAFILLSIFISYNPAINNISTFIYEALFRAEPVIYLLYASSLTSLYLYRRRKSICFNSIHQHVMVNGRKIAYRDIKYIAVVRKASKLKQTVLPSITAELQLILHDNTRILLAEGGLIDTLEQSAIKISHLPALNATVHFDHMIHPI